MVVKLVSGFPYLVYGSRYQCIGKGGSFGFTLDANDHVYWDWWEKWGIYSMQCWQNLLPYILGMLTLCKKVAVRCVVAAVIALFLCLVPQNAMVLEEPGTFFYTETVESFPTVVPDWEGEKTFPP
jgi:hypothetical protein